MSDFIEWKGGECPVEEGTLVDVIHANGNQWNNQRALIDERAGNWLATGHVGSIVGYRLSVEDVYEYPIGSAKDFINAPEEATVVIQVNDPLTEQIYAEKFEKGASWWHTSGNLADTGLHTFFYYGKVVAERVLKQKEMKVGGHYLIEWDIITPTFITEHSVIYLQEDGKERLLKKEGTKFISLNLDEVNTIKALTKVCNTSYSFSYDLLKAIREGDIPNIHYEGL